MDDLIERYIQYLQYERNASPHTVRNYRSDLMQLRDFLTGRTALQEPDRAAIRDVLRGLERGTQPPPTVTPTMPAPPGSAP